MNEISLKRNKGDKRHPGQEKLRQHFWWYYYNEACRRVRHLDQIIDQMERYNIKVPKGVRLPEKDYLVLDLADKDIEDGLEKRRVRPNNLMGIANRADERYRKAQAILEKEWQLPLDGTV